MGHVKIWLPNHPKASHGMVWEHILIAERALGKLLPFKAEVHHFDENNRNNKNDNLVICENHSYHRLLHARKRILDAGGNPNIDKICGFCKKIKSKVEFDFDPNVFDGHANRCSVCRYNIRHDISA